MEELSLNTREEEPSCEEDEDVQEEQAAKMKASSLELEYILIKSVTKFRDVIAPMSSYYDVTCYFSGKLCLLFAELSDASIQIRALECRKKCNSL